MSVIIALFQAILQSIGWLIPISEYGHASVYHDFAGRADGSVAAITGVIHIGIAIGIVLAMLKLFVKLSAEFAGCTVDLAKRDFSYKARPARKFMLMTLVSFVPMILWLVPIGKFGFLYKVLKSTGYNGTLFDDGIFLALTGGLLLLAARQMSLEKTNKPVSLSAAITVGALSLLFVPVSGLSLVGGAFAVLIMFGVSKKLALRYCLVMSVPVLLVKGIVEICVSAYKADAVQIVISLVISVIASFVCVRALKIIINKGYLKYIGIYDLGIGAIVFVIGIIQLIVR